MSTITETNMSRLPHHNLLTHRAISLPTPPRHLCAMSNDIYPALDRCYRLGRYLVQEILTDYAVWAGQDRVLCALRPDYANTQGELSRKLYMDERTLHRSLRYLAKVHYIEMRESRTDARVHAIHLTLRGKGAVEAVKYAHEIAAKQMLVAMSPEEKLEFYKLLKFAAMREDALRARRHDLPDLMEGGFF
jgi:DNA-binding MarR family transcriptional regulator